MRRCFSFLIVVSFALNSQENVYAQKADILRTYSDTTIKWRRSAAIVSEVLVGLDAQESEFSRNETRALFEVGVGKSSHIYGFEGGAATGFYAAEEVAVGKKFFIGTKVGAYGHYLLDFGLAVVYYTDFEKSNLKLRPELGAGLGALRLVFGYNIPTIDNKAFKELTKSKGQFCCQVFISTKKKHIEKLL